MNEETTKQATDTARLTYLTIAEAAEVMRVKPWPVFRAIEKGKLTAFQPLGKRSPWLIRPSDLRAFIESSR